MSTPRRVNLSHVSTFRRTMGEYDFGPKDTIYSIYKKLEENFNDPHINSSVQVEDGYLIVRTALSIEMPEEKKSDTPKRGRKPKAEVVDTPEGEEVVGEVDDFTAKLERTFYIDGHAVVALNTKGAMRIGQINSALNALENAGIEVEYIEVTPSDVIITAAPPVVAAAPVAVEATPSSGPTVICGDCQNPLTPYTANSGKFMSVKMQADMTTRNYKKPLCKVCNAKRFRAQQAS